jgi:acyl-CoA synthetase (AMP-forming)/AMP-acid ligase II
MDDARETVSSKPEYGRRLMVNILDRVAATDPSRPFIFVPRSSEPRDGWKPIMYKEISNAVNYVSQKIAEKFREESRQDAFPTVSYIGPSDIRYLIVLLASVKAHCKALFISPRNSSEAQLSLFKATNCELLFYAEPFQTMIQHWLREHLMQVIMVPSADEWLRLTPALFPYNRAFDEGRWDPLIVLHTSGSTGLPKPIIVRQGSLAIADQLRLRPMFSFKEWATRSKRLFLPMPLFHMAGVVVSLVMTLYYDVPVALGIPERPLGPELVAECLANADVDAVMLPPSILEALSLNRDFVTRLAKLSYVGYGGGE